MLTSEEAIVIGCKKYRELYPKGMIPAAIEEHAVLGATPNGSSVTIHVTYWFEGESEPFYLFRASVNRESGDVTVTNTEDWHLLENRTFDNSQSL
ncbi:hypothetical protein Mal35_20210 [Gimesia maris]|uniref:hypothetical protein n=1 Tax=Gimesia maris TaxID=122 RepID=UPI00118CE4B5|nr:hypothetical protein [Gimesia maris]QDT78572.1 hypothetical protein Mal35_20210 [Gimesia maris]